MDEILENPARNGELLTAEEKKNFKRYLRKVDLMIMPLYCVLYWLAVMDRNNLGNANIEGFSVALNLKSGEFNWVASVLFITYVACEIPSTLLLQKIGTRLWLPLITIFWGASCILMGFVTNFTTAMIVRLLLGAFESGFAPGFIFYTTFWYPNAQRLKRISIFFSAGMFSGIFAGPIALGLTKIGGSLRPYQYIFVVEGALTIFIGFISYFIVENYPETSKRILDGELSAAKKLFNEDQKEMSQKKNITVKNLSALLDARLWVLGIIFAIGVIGGFTQAIFGPKVIKEMGYTNAQAQVFASIPSACGFLGQLLPAIIPNYAKKVRIGYILILHYFTTAALYIGLVFAGAPGLKLALLALANFALSPTMPLVSYWMTNNTYEEDKKSVGSAMTIMLGGLASFVGSQIYRDSDAPLYKMGHGIVAGMFVVGGVMTICLYLYFYLANRRCDRLQRELPSSDKSQTATAYINKANPGWRYTL
ncbi:putative transporter [Zancudomyces culisetae]|uniref:Putative transporter n=1 Tax=Zancudomyces culisetae TaxID=1213189 RepID=A0A1R1PCC4_ZANCU|nr:putative transporter [Zancudomyces culisetae]OMH82086.1 putative transporter [Zancudomyces culisetae]OMH82168.1 putative transporter [Zancudomyces culisetae]|eukprot:OMH78614.1 putative transporter [Zancudomyces culisetae]